MKGEPLLWKDWGLDFAGFLTRMEYSAERVDANMEALERGEGNPAPSTHNHDLLSLELRSGGRGVGQTRAINTAKEVRGSGYPGGCSCPCQRVQARDMWPCLSLCQYLTLLILSLLPGSLSFIGLPLSVFCHLLLGSLSFPRNLSPLALRLVFPFHSECLPLIQVFVFLSGSMYPLLYFWNLLSESMSHSIWVSAVPLSLGLCASVPAPGCVSPSFWSVSASL